ncbi:hypothetical protein [Aquitalea magnusonii]|nr:hypothetical protein [Aquitalea magnusonii]
MKNMNPTNDRHYAVDYLSCQYKGLKMEANMDKSNTPFVVDCVVRGAKFSVVALCIAQVVKAAIQVLPHMLH